MCRDFSLACLKILLVKANFANALDKSLDDMSGQRFESSTNVNEGYCDNVDMIV